MSTSAETISRTNVETRSPTARIAAIVAGITSSSLDAQVISHLTTDNLESLNEYWKRLGLPSRQGYFTAEKGAPMSARHLHGLPN